RDNGLRIASLIDLAAAKVRVAQVRAEARDYVDIDALIGAGIDLSSALGAAITVYGDEFNPQVSLKALVYFGESGLATLSSAVKARLRQAVRSVKLDRLPTFHAIRE